MKKLILITSLALASRIFYIALAYLSSQSFTNYDKSTQIVTHESFNFLLRWDAIYFHEIMKNGYSREHLIAFFPAYPFLVSYISGIIGLSHLNTGILISNFLFLLTSLILYKLSLRRYGKEIAYSTVLFFILNPSSIIHSTLYSESLYNFLFICGFYLIDHNYKFSSIIFFSLSTITRSNGILNALLLIDRKRPIQSFIYIFQILLPFILFQVHCHTILTLEKHENHINIATLKYLKNLITLKNLKTIFTLKTLKNLKNISIPYQHIQTKYWNQGFLTFYTYNNIPNIIIGLPFIIFITYCLISFVYSKLKQKSKQNYFTNIYNQNTVVLFLLLCIQVLMCLFFIHMQIIFRFVSYNPLVYWFMAFMYEKIGVGFGCVCFGYFFYGVVYAVLFGSYFPPA